ncbi:hypothetical protein HDV06_007056 [Boothiomyces sp. JEL0866]|nr:hypothetical protein HDV06_007056 [Boothiomyces sp. JEL0866]
MTETPSEWDIMANKYNKVFRPRFVPVYEEIAKLVHQYNAKTVLDFATGPGEPALTILKSTVAAKVIACDVSAGMLSYLQKSVIPEGKELQVRRIEHDQDIQGLHADIVTCSFAIMYNSNLQELLSLFQSSAPLLICSVWAHPSTVPFLRIVKSACSEKLTDHYFETEDPSFSLWKREKVQQILNRSGYEIVEYNLVDLPMEFHLPDDLMEFCEGSDWFAGTSKEEAIARARKLMEGYFDGQRYKMNNQAYVFVAKKLE